MELSADVTLPYSRDRVFAAYRDKLAELSEYLPNVRSIEVKSRIDDGAIVDLVNIWHGGGEIPKAARAFLSESMLSFTDYAKWDETDHTCAWRIETHAFTEAVSCSGKNRFVADGDKTRLEIRGTLAIDAKKVKGVPSFLAGKVGKAIEDFLGARIQPNLVEVSEGVGKYLADHPA